MTRGPKTEGPTCEYFAAGEYCREHPTVRYLVGPRCAGHTPAQLAGRPEPAPDSNLTAAGLRRAARVAVKRARVEEEHRSNEVDGWTTRPPQVSPLGWVSQPGRMFTSADVDMTKVRAAQAAVGRKLTRDAQRRRVAARESR